MWTQQDMRSNQMQSQQDTGSNQMQSQQDTGSNQMQSQQQSSGQTPPRKESQVLSDLGNILLLIGETIVVATKEDMLTLLAAYIKLAAGGLEIAAAYLEANETARGMNLPENTITPTGKQKITGALVSEIGGIMLTDVLQKEIAARKGRRVNTILSPFVAGLGAFSA